MKTFRDSRLANHPWGTTTLCLASAVGVSAAAAETGDSSQGNTVQSLVVTAQRPSLQVLSETLQNTAQSVTVVSKEVLQDEGVASLQDALKNVPGITLNAGEGGSHGDTVNLRGFSASDDFFLDGLRDTGFYTRDSFDVEAIEVYKGPASTLFGRGSTGGVIDQVSKTPRLGPFEDASIALGTNREVRGTADIDQALGESAALRVNAMGLTSGVAGRPFVLNRRWGFAPSLALGIGKPTTFTLSYLHQQEDNVPDYGFPLLGGAPVPAPHDAYYGLPSDDRVKSDVNVVTGRLVHQINDALSISETARYGDYGFSSFITTPHYGVVFSNTTPPVASCSNSGPGPTPGVPAADLLICRDRPSAQGTVTTAMSVTDLTYKFQTGPLSHTLVATLDLERETADLVRYANQISQIAPTPLLNPDPNETFPGHQTTVTQRPDITADTLGGMLLDSIELGSHLEVIGALRFDDFAAHYDEPITNKHFARADDIASPRAAIVYKPTQYQSFYVSYGTSFDPSAENLSLSASSVALAPERDRTFEVGAKTAWLNGRLSLTAAAFNTEITNARTADPDNPALQLLAGSQRVNGMELGASGYLTEHWEILAGYTYLDARTVKSTDPAQVGQFLPNTARHQANIWTTYEFPGRWMVGAGANYLGRRNADPQGQDVIPAYLTFDAMVGFKATDNISLQLNAYNLADRFYFANAYESSVTENHIIPGAGRTVTLTALVHY